MVKRKQLCLDSKDGQKVHTFTFMNNVPLNDSNPDLLVNILEYLQINKDGKVATFSWVTDIPLTEENVTCIMCVGRARWKNENETFNTLKNQGYNLEHNYGLGKKHLSAVFAHLMMLAFLIDQVQQMCCPLFKAALAKCRFRKYLWEDFVSFSRPFLLHRWRLFCIVLST